MRSRLWTSLIGLLTVVIVLACASPAPTPGTQPAASVPTTEPVANPCQPAPSELAAQLSAGITAAGDSKVTDVYVVATESDGPPWQFIAGRIHAAGMNGDVAMWATASLDLDNDPLIVAVDFMAAEFSTWNYPQGDRNYFSDYKDAIKTAEHCLN